MTQDTTWGRRLLVERDRLGYKNMEDFAQSAGVAAKTLYNYVNEETQLNIDFMIKFAQLGGDVQYVVTGVRSDNLPDPTYTIESERIMQRALLRQIEEIVSLLNASISKGYGSNGS